MEGSEGFPKEGTSKPVIRLSHLNSVSDGIRLQSEGMLKTNTSFTEERGLAFDVCKKQKDHDIKRERRPDGFPCEHKHYKSNLILFLYNV